MNQFSTPYSERLDLTEEEIKIIKAELPWG